MRVNHKNVLTLELQSLSTERIIVHSSSQQTLASAVGTRDAARENDLYSSAIVLLISFPKPWMGKYMQQNNSNIKGLKPFSPFRQMQGLQVCQKGF